MAAIGAELKFKIVTIDPGDAVVQWSQAGAYNHSLFWSAANTTWVFRGHCGSSASWRRER